MSSFPCLRPSMGILGVMCIILLAMLGILFQQEFSIRIVHPGGTISSLKYIRPGLLESEEEMRRLHVNMTSVIQTSPASGQVVGNTAATKKKKKKKIKNKISDDVLVRVVHPSGSGGTTLCRLIKQTEGARMTEFRKIHNCNPDGAGPKTRQNMTPDSPWRRCNYAKERGVRMYNWLFLEYEFDVDYPCAQNVKHVMLFRDPWKRTYSLLVKRKEANELPLIFSQFVELMTSETVDTESSTDLRELVRKNDNAYIRFLIGSQRAYAIPFRGITREHLEMAKRVVDGFDLLLETEDLNRAGTLLTHVLGDYFRFPGDTTSLKKNEHHQPTLPSNYDNMRRLFEELNSFDRELYEYMVTVKEDQHAQWKD